MIVHGTIAGVGMTWRYCVTRERIDGEDFYEIREVYTEGDGKLSWTKRPIGPHGYTWAEIVDDLAKMTEATHEPVLDLTLDPPQFVPAGQKTS